MQQSEQTNTNQQPLRSNAAKWINILLWVLIVVLFAVVVVKTFFVVRVDGQSMMPTYADKDIVFVNRFGKVTRGDVVTFYSQKVPPTIFGTVFMSKQDKQQYPMLIKRVVAVAGDKLWIQTNTNGEMELWIEPLGQQAYCEQTYSYSRGDNTFTLPYPSIDVNGNKTDNGVLENATQQNPFVVSEGHFFVLGDNRANSRDSRKYGQISLDSLYGVVIN